MLTYLDKIPGVRKIFGSSIILSASCETWVAILSLVDGVSRGLKAVNDNNGVGREGLEEGIAGVISPGEAGSSDKSVDAEDLCASAGVSRPSDESEIDWANDSHFANSDCTCSSEGRPGEL